MTALDADTVESGPQRRVSRSRRITPTGVDLLPDAAAGLSLPSAWHAHCGSTCSAPVFSVLGYDGTDAFPFPEGVAAQIEKIQRAVLAVIRDFCPPDASFVFTNVLDARAPGDKAWFRRVERLAGQRGAGFFPVWLTCEAAVIRRRKNTPDRRARLKDIDLTNISRWSEGFEVLRVPHPNALTVDTSYREPRQTARLILEHVQGAARVGRPAAPDRAKDDA